LPSGLSKVGERGVPVFEKKLPRSIGTIVQKMSVCLVTLEKYKSAFVSTIWVPHSEFGEYLLFSSSRLFEICQKDGIPEEDIEDFISFNIVPSITNIALLYD
jgi:hypothetical protein